MDGPVGFSSQDSRQKLGKNFVHVSNNGSVRPPRQMVELLSNPVEMSNFIVPGKYSLTDRKTFDFGFLAFPTEVVVKTVRPRTLYNWRKNKQRPAFVGAEHLEFTISLGDASILIGNLPLPLLVEQEDFAIHGFGVGILSDSEPAERRKLLFKGGPCPSYAYLIEEHNGEVYGLNSHDAGIEQIFIRSHPFNERPHWEVTITSYERIVDLVKYRIAIPEALVEKTRAYTRNYVSPVYFTYRDDNIR